MKKFLSIALMLSLVAALFSGCYDKKTVINVYNWGEYISDGSDDTMDVIEEFNKTHPNIKAVYSTFASNEEMYAKIKSGGAQYDVVIPSDYMIGRMIEESMLEKLDYKNIPNYSYIMDDFKGQKLDFDPTGEYSVAYTWGTVGIVYNKKMVQEPVDSWNILWNQKYAKNILMFNNSRDAFGIAQKKLGYSQNTTDKKELDACAEELKKQKEVVQAYVMDEIFDKMENGDAAIAPYYAGDAVTMIENNPDLAFVVPKEGSNRFVDSMVIPKGTKNKAEAEEFINFMCKTDVAKANIEFIGYSTPHKAAYDALDREIKENQISYPKQEVLNKCESFKNLPKETNQYMEDLWVGIKAGSDS